MKFASVKMVGGAHPTGGWGFEFGLRPFDADEHRSVPFILVRFFSMPEGALCKQRK